ncbi:MAG: iron-containing alcohol dehydrogenase [Actinobacteria bacterium]|nr:iron-containing alcohol dehydrogenase [Actinomycetota bacterium]
MLNFEFENKVKLYFGTGKINKLGKLCKKIGKHPMLVTTHELSNKKGFGIILYRVIDILEKSGFNPVIYDRAVLNPTTISIDEGIKIAVANNVDFVIGLGGGSGVDTAKAIAVGVKSGRPIWDFFNCKEHEASDIKEAIPIVAVDTTAGTGTAVTKFFVITNPVTKEKAGNGSKDTYANFSIVDPELMKLVPRNVTSYTGMDVFFHAFEAFLSTSSNPISDLFALKAIELVKDNLPLVYDDGEDLKARENMALASIYAGYAIDAAAVVLLHSMGHSISGITGAAHGAALSSLSEAWLKYTYPSAYKKINRVIEIFGVNLKDIKKNEASAKAVNVIHDFKIRVGAGITLRKTGISEADYNQIVQDTFSTMQFCIDNQPGKPVKKEDMLVILKGAYKD